MTLSTGDRTSSFVRFLCLVMAPFAVLVIGILVCQILSLRFVLMAVLAQLPAGFAFLPRMVAFDAIDLQRLRMFLVAKLYLPIRVVINDLILCKDARNHQNGE